MSQFKPDNAPHQPTSECLDTASCNPQVLDRRRFLLSVSGLIIAVALPVQLSAVKNSYADAISAPLPDEFGGYDLQINDSDRQYVYGGGKQKDVPANVRGVVARLQETFRTLGFRSVDQDKRGEFRNGTRDAVIEFQVYASCYAVAKYPGGYDERQPEGVSALQQAINRDVFTPPFTGIVDKQTRRLLSLWKRDDYRSPVIIAAWQRMPQPSDQEHSLLCTRYQRTDRIWRHGGGSANLENLWAIDTLRDLGPRLGVYVRDLTWKDQNDPDLQRVYNYPPDRDHLDWIRLGRIEESPNALGFRGPRVMPEDAWPECEVLPRNIVPKDFAANDFRPKESLAALTDSERSRFYVVRAVSEQRCGGFLDGARADTPNGLQVGLLGDRITSPTDRRTWPDWLRSMENNPRYLAEFRRLFGRYGLGGPVASRLESWHWLYRFAVASRDRGIPPLTSHDAARLIAPLAALQWESAHQRLTQIGKLRFGIDIPTNTEITHPKCESPFLSRHIRGKRISEVFRTEKSAALLLYWFTVASSDKSGSPLLPLPLNRAIDYAQIFLCTRRYAVISDSEAPPAPPSDRSGDLPKDLSELLDQNPEDWKKPEVHLALADGLFEAASHDTTLVNGERLRALPVAELMAVYGWPTWETTGNPNTNCLGYELDGLPFNLVQWWRVTAQWDRPDRDVSERLRFVKGTARRIRGGSSWSALSEVENSFVWD